MANIKPWFKFYGAEYLSDPKVLGLSCAMRSCWITLLSYASLTDGVIRNLTETTLKVQAGMEVDSAEWQANSSVLNQFAALGMVELNDNNTIVIINWEKRQESHLTPYERVKRSRAKKRNDNDTKVIKITGEESRVEESRVDNTNEHVAFEAFWKLYPKKKNRGQAEKAWKKIKPTPGLIEKILASVSAQRETRGWKKEGGQFIPYPATFLNAQGWEDEIEKPEDRKSNVIKI